MRKSLYLLVLAVALVAGCTQGATTTQNSELLRISGVTVTPGTAVAPDEIITIRMKLDNIGQEDVKFAYKNPCWKNPAANPSTGNVIAAHAGSTITGMAAGTGPINPTTMIISDTTSSGDEPKLTAHLAINDVAKKQIIKSTDEKIMRDVIRLGYTFPQSNKLQVVSDGAKYTSGELVFSGNIIIHYNSIDSTPLKGTDQYKLTVVDQPTFNLVLKKESMLGMQQIYREDTPVSVQISGTPVYSYSAQDPTSGLLEISKYGQITITKIGSAAAQSTTSPPPAELPQLDISASPTEVTVGVPKDVTFTVTEKKERGLFTCWWNCNFPVKDATVSAPAGVVSDPQQATTLADGTAKLKITAPAGASSIVVTAKYTDKYREGRTSIAVVTANPTPTSTTTPPPLQPAAEHPQIYISAKPDKVTAGTKTNVIFTVTEKKAGVSSPVSDANIAFSIGGKTMTSTTKADGSAAVDITAPANENSILVSASKTGYLYGTATIYIGTTPTPSANAPKLSIILYSSDPPKITAGTTAKLTLKVTENGNPVEGAYVQVPSTISSATPRTDRNGIAELQITVPDRENGVIAVTASKEGYSAGTISITINAKPILPPSTSSNGADSSVSRQTVEPKSSQQECCAVDKEYCPMATLGKQGGEIGSMSNIIYDHCGALYGKDEEIQFTPVTSGLETENDQLVLKPSRSALLEWTLKAPSETTIANMQQECTFRFQINYQARAETYTYIYFANPDEKNQRTYTNKDMNLRGENVANFGPVYINFETAQDQPIKGSKETEKSTWTLYATVRNAGDGIGKVLKNSFQIQLPEGKFTPDKSCTDFSKPDGTNTITRQVPESEKDDSRLMLYSKQSSRFSCTLPAPKVDVLEPYRFISSADYVYTIDKELKITTAPKRT